MTTTIVNDRDSTLQLAQRAIPQGVSKYVLLSVSTPFFHVSAGGAPTPASITLTGTPINIAGGNVTFSVTAGATLKGTGNTRTLAFTDMTVDNVTVTATITDLGQTYTATQVIGKVQDGVIGKDGPAGAQYATAYLYKWSTVNPGLPTGTSTLTWASGANTSYIGSDAWNISVPANPGTTGILLWVATKQVTAPAGTQATDLTYSAGATVQAISANGLNGGKGDAGAPGVKSATATAYAWSNGPAPSIAGSATWTWANASYNNVPQNWSKTKTDAPALGYTLYEARFALVDSTGATLSAIDWASASITGIGYMPTNGSAGSTGTSVMIAYTLVDGATLATTPAQSNPLNGQVLPATGTWGETRAWQATPPVAGAGQAVFQSNGTYNPVTNQSVWGLPYLSNWRVGSLSAISANLGAITAGSININNGVAIIDAAGKATFRAIDIQTADGTSILKSGGQIADVALPDTVKNSVLMPSIKAAAQAGVFTPLPGHTFDFTSGTDGWYSMNSTGVVQANGVLTISGPNSDPMFARDFAGFSGAIYDKIRMRVRRKAGTGWDGQIFFNREGTDGSSILANPNLVAGEWTVLEWDMSKPSPGNGTNWPSQTITHIRIDLGNSPQDVFEIDWIAIGSTKPVTLSGIGFTGDPNANYSGGNLLYNGDFSNGVAGWEVKFDDNGCNVTVANQLHPGVGNLDWILNKGNGEGTSTLQVNQNNTLQGHAFELWGDPIPVKVGARYCVSAYTGSHRCKIDVYGVYCDVNGVSIRAFNIGLDYNEDGVMDKHGGISLGDYYRHQQCTTIPDGVYSIRIVLQKGATKTSMGNDSWMMACRAQVEEVSATATTAGPWNSPPVGRAVYTDVAKANAAIQDMSLDSVLDRGEKAQLVKEWVASDSKWSWTRAQAYNLGVDYSYYDAAHQAASDYLVGLRPNWNDTTQNTNISRGEFNGYFQRMYEAQAKCEAAVAAKAATTATYESVSNRPQDPSNLVRKSNFDDDNVGYWTAPGTEAKGGLYNTSIPGRRTLLTHGRDCLEINNPIPVTPKETIYFTVWMNTEATSYTCAFGMFVYNIDGAVVRYVPACIVPAGRGWGYYEGSFTIPEDIGASYATPWLQQDNINNGAFPDNGNWLRATGMWMGRHQRSATNGATFGVNVKGQIDTNNVATYIAPNTIKNTQIGGDIFSSNWNGDTGRNGAGWYLERGTGNFYGNAAKLRGAIMSGGYTKWEWPTTWDAVNKMYDGGYYLGSEGLLLGNSLNNKFFQATWDGNVYAPQFKIENGSAYFNGRLEAGTVASGSLSSLTATIGTLRTATSGARTEIKDNLITIFDSSNIARIELGAG